MAHTAAPKKCQLERLNDALEINPNPTLTMSKQGKILGANELALECFGYKADELIGQEIEILVPERYRGRHVHHRSGFFKEPTARSMGAGRDLSGLRKDGTEFPIEIGLKPFEVGNEEIVVMATIIDISERKKLEELIQRQHDDLMELSTPVIRLWDGILVLPIVGKLDTERSGIMVEQLLSALSESSSTIAILDISGVPTVDTHVAQHLMKAIDASRLMGANCIVSGIRPEIANTIVNLGLDLSQVKTRSTMSRALHDAFKMLKLQVVAKEKKKKKKD